MSLSKKQIKSILEKQPDKPYTDGENVYFFYDDQIHKKPIEHFNSSFNVMRWQAEFIDCLEGDLTLSKRLQLEDFDFHWSLLEAEYNLLDDNAPFTRYYVSSRESYFSPLSEFLSAVKLGAYPRPEVMLALSDCFQFYYDSNGKVTLEQVFFGKLKKGVGNKAARNKSNEKFIKFGTAIYLNDGNKTQIELAEDVIKELGLSDTPESLIRQHNRKTQGKPSLDDYFNNFSEND